MKIAIYTANIGGFDEVISPALLEGKPNPDYDYIYISDIQSPILSRAKLLGWRPFRVRKSIKSNRRLSRYYHIQSMKILREFEYDFAIQHGANIRLLFDPERLVSDYLGDADIAVFKHPHRSSTREEMFACLDMKKDTVAYMLPQIRRYEQEGYPVDSFGLSACMLVVWRHSPKVGSFQDAWWGEVASGSVREQLSFDYVRWKMPDIKVVNLPGDPFRSPIIQYHVHGARK